MPNNSKTGREETDYELALRLAGMLPPEATKAEEAHVTPDIATGSSGTSFSVPEPQSKPKVTVQTNATERTKAQRPLAEPSTPKRVEVRVNMLNHPTSILKKWQNPKSPPTALDEVSPRQKPRASQFAKTRQQPGSKSVPDLSIGEPTSRNFRRVFKELDQAPLLSKGKRVDLDALDHELMAVEFSSEKRRRRE